MVKIFSLFCIIVLFSIPTVLLADENSSLGISEENSQVLMSQSNLNDDNVSQIAISESFIVAASGCKKYGEKCSFSNECCGNLFCLGRHPNGDRYCKKVGDKDY